MAVTVFGAGLDRAVRYATALAETGVQRGLLGPREFSRVWERHLLNCAVLGPLLPVGALVVDLGSGAGLPGVVLALVRPDVRLVLLEPLQRRALFLEQVVAELGLGQVEVRRGRAEDQYRVNADVVTARAVAPLARLAGWALPLLRPGGVLLAMKGRSASDELSQASGTLERLGGRDADLVVLGEGIVDPPVRVVRVVAGPQSTGRPARR